MKAKMETLKYCDLEAAVRVADKAFRDIYTTHRASREILYKNDNRAPVFIAAKMGKEVVGIVGFTMSNMSPSWYEVGWLMVLPKFQRRGIGRHLTLKAHERIARDKRAYAVILITQRPKFYETLGYEITHEFGVQWYLMVRHIRGRVM